MTELKILIAGTGQLAEEFEQYVNRGGEKIAILGYVETTPQEKYKKGKRIYSYREIVNLQYDWVVVANIYSDEIRKTALEEQLDVSKFIYLRPWTYIDEIEGNRLFNWEMLDRIAPQYLKEKMEHQHGYFIANRMYLDDVKSTLVDKYTVLRRDYFRYRTFELVSDQLKELEGAVAEVGVFQGEFAMLINAKFPKKKLYLFDTFESFEQDEFKKERNEGNCEDGFDKVFTYTSIDRVMKRMPHPENCIVRKGLFPTSAEGIDEKFLFVSIDVDFEKSIYESLCWFYPKMVSGGIIFVHDYNNKTLFGVKKAVDKFEEENGRLHKMPLADWGGTMAIIK